MFFHSKNAAKIRLFFDICKYFRRKIRKTYNLQNRECKIGGVNDYQGKLAALYGKHLLRKTGILSARMRILRIDNYPACERVSQT